MTCITRKARLARTHRLARSLTNRNTSGSTSKSCASSGHSQLRPPFPYQSRLFFPGHDRHHRRFRRRSIGTISALRMLASGDHIDDLPLGSLAHSGRKARNTGSMDRSPSAHAETALVSRITSPAPIRSTRFLLDDPAVRWMVQSRTEAGRIMRGRSSGRRFVRLPRRGPCRCTRSAPACCGRRRPVPAK